MPIATDPVTMLPDELARYTAVATLFLKYGKNVGGRVNRVLDALAASELKMKVEVIDDGAVHHDRTVHHR